MTEHIVRRPLERRPTHPGELIEEALKDHLRIPVADAARRLGVSRQTLHHVMSGSARLTADLAVLFGKMADMSPELLLRMQASYDLWASRQKLADRLPKIETVHRAA
jgi:addiction module HigA family antidote